MLIPTWPAWPGTAGCPAVIEKRFKKFLAELQAEHRLRRTRTFGPAEPGFIRLNGREILNLSSNDYMGLSRHPQCARRAGEYARAWGTGAGSSRLICGTLDIHSALETRLAGLKGSQAALIVGSGFMTNSQVLAALLDARILEAAPLVFSDKLNHASMHQGCQLAGIRQIRFRHLDMNHLADLLAKHAASPGPRFILSETVFSMDGDRADVPALAGLAEKHGAFLYLDEAHAMGVLGPGGLGLAAGVAMDQSLVMGTFSKGLGSYGGYVCCSETIREYLVNRSPGFIFSTALPPPVLGAVDAALDLMPDMDQARQDLQATAAWLRQSLGRAGLGTGTSSTQIVPVMIGQSDRALAASQALEEAGVLAVAVRPPTVPEGTSRLRLSLTAAHSRPAVEKAGEIIIQVLGSLA